MLPSTLIHWLLGKERVGITGRNTWMELSIELTWNSNKPNNEKLLN